MSVRFAPRAGSLDSGRATTRYGLTLPSCSSPSRVLTARRYGLSGHSCGILVCSPPIIWRGGVRDTCARSSFSARERTVVRRDDELSVVQILAGQLKAVFPTVAPIRCRRRASDVSAPAAHGAGAEPRALRCVRRSTARLQGADLCGHLPARLGETDPSSSPSALTVHTVTKIIAPGPIANHGVVVSAPCA
jgi:hypothetical protein